MNSEVGQKYRVLQELGQGGAAKVYLAVALGPQGFSKLVVLKAPKPSGDEQLGASSSFLNEARLAARLNHPNIVETYEVFEYSNVPIIVMQYLEGQALSDINARGRDRLSVTMYLHVFCDTLAGLHHSHELRGYDGKPLNVVHRDVSPQNIFVTYDGQVKVLDFGIAKLVGLQDETATGVVKGKLGYMAPEQVLCSEIDRRTDIFSVGVMLWEAAAGERMYKGVSEAGILRQLVNGSFRSPREVRPVDPELERVIMKALSPSMDDRYATALEMQADVEAMITTPRSQLQRKLSAMVSEAFHEEREARAATISQALAKATTVETGLQIDFGNAPLATSNGDLSQNLSLETVSGTLGSLGRTATGTTLTASGTPGSKSGQRWWVAVGALAIFAAVAGVAATRLGTRGDTVSRVDPASVAQAAVRKVRVVTTPDGARVLLDGKQVGTTPIIIERPGDKLDHQLRLVLEGYESFEQSIRLENDADLRLALVSTAPSATGAAGSSPSGNPTSQGRSPAAGNPRPAVHHRPGSAPAGAKKPAVADTPPTPAATREPSCSPPYYFDENGLRRFKPQCI